MLSVYFYLGIIPGINGTTMLVFVMVSLVLSFIVLVVFSLEKYEETKSSRCRFQ